ncbi:hypothetical protein [Eisenbergiella tayi]|uniref:hypothetical protein n=1 Tax=Eisenbergiella tayi TaxID=1432052 RepID=UPI0008493DDE|nr:hypothetical protein [Eisenbergiella tayi]ODR35242.1 hypothetical protein BEI60_19475 [Eisenbergiella tayi]
MDIKKLVFIIGGIDIVLLAVCLFLYLGKDRTAPVISFGENLASYEEGMDEELLLEGVTAVDAKDGDVSGSLLVEKVTGTTGKEVIVTYVARDSANNVGKASRAFPVAGTYKDGDVIPVMGGVLEGGGGTDESSEGESETETETGTMSEGESGSAEDGEDGDEAVAEPDRGEEVRQEEPDGEPEPPVGPNPVLVMSGDVVSTKVGTAPNWGQVIGAMSDDKDDYNTLYRNLKLEGHVNLDEAGEYPVTLYTVDTDGNRSEVRNLVVKVEE